MKDLLRDVFAKFFGYLGVQMSVSLQHLKCTVAHGGSELKIGSSLGRCHGGKSVSHVMCAALWYVCFSKSCLPGLFNIDPSKGSFASKDERFKRLSILVKFSEFFKDRLRKGNASRPSVLGFFDVGQLIIEIDVFPLEIEDFSLASSGSDCNEYDGVEISGAAFTACVE